MKILKQLLVVAAIAAALPITASAAQILSQSRSLQAIVDAADYNPTSGDEVSDFKNAAGFGAFNTSAGVTFPFNSNLASSMSAQNTQVDTTALRIYGTGTAATHIDTHFDNTDVSLGAFVNNQANTSMSVEFKLNNSGKIHVSMTIETATSATDVSGAPIAEARIQTSSGAAVWRQLITSTNRMSFNGDIPLAAGTYQIVITAASNVTDSKAGSRVVDTSANFGIDASIIEDAGVPPRKKK